MKRTAPRPATKQSDLLQEINLLSDRENVDDLTLRRLKMEAKKLANAAPDEGRVVLGALAALDWNLEGVHKHYSVAIRVMNSAHTRQAYATALQVMGYMREALEQELVAYQLAPEDGSVLREAFECSIAAGEFLQAEKIISQWEKSFPNARLKDPTSLEFLMSVFEEVKRQALREEQIQESLELAYRLCRQKRIRPKGLDLYLVPLEDGDGGYDIVSTIFVQASVEQAAELSMELFEKVYDFPELLQGAWRGFLVSFERVQHDGGIPV